MGYSITLRDAFLNFVFRGAAAWTPPAGGYDIALLTTNPSDDTGTGLVECTTTSWTNYARVNVPTTGYAAPAGGTVSPQTISNSAAVNYGTATVTGAAPVITGVAWYQHGTNTLDLWAPLSSNQTINNGDPVTFPIGDLMPEA